MSTFLFLFLLALLALFYYCRIYDRWWLGTLALLLVLTKLGYTLNTLLLGLYIGAAKVLKDIFHPKEK